jgi:AraC-like DNA-binding protein
MKNEADIQLARTIATSLLNEITGPKSPYTVDLTRHFVNALIVIAARNISLVNPANLRPNSDKRIQDVIHYIQANINTPHRLKTTPIAKHFGVAATYFGTYFKAQCGETYQQFITHYKLRLIEHRLRFSDKRINEIADEFGFSDESHLNKFFKKHKGLNLSAFRRSSVNTYASSLVR